MILALYLSLSAFITIINAQAVTRWPKSDCKPATDNCNNWCDGQASSTDTCEAIENEYCNFLGKRCKCKCLSREYGDCSWADIIKAGDSSCSSQVMNLDNIDLEIGKAMGFNIGANVLGAVPILGDISNIWWAAISNSADGPISSPQQLTNNLINNINEKFNHLKRCMDEKIANLKTSLYQGKVRDVGTRYYQVRSATNDDKILYLSNLFSDFNGYIADIFMDDTNNNYNYAEYESLLPVYTALVPIWAALSSDQLSVQKIQNDDGNFKSDVNTAISGFDTMKAWLLRARDKIEKSVTPEEIATCLGANMFDDVNEMVGMTVNDRNKKCIFRGTDWQGSTNFDARFKDYCEKGYYPFLNEKKNHIMTGVKQLIQVFNGQYLNKIELYIESLERIRDGDATSDNILKDNILEIRNMKGKCLDIHWDDYESNVDGGKVQIWDSNGQDNQKWYYDMDTKEIKNKKGKCLDINWNDYISNVNGGKVQIWDCNGGDNQKFNYNWSTLQIKNEKGKCLDIDYNHYKSNINGGKVHIWDCNRGNNQKWNLYPDFIEN